jgi:excinuclease ABC subunit C
MTMSELDDVPGLGPARRTALLKHFGSLQRLRQASPEQIAEVPGIGLRMAETILAALLGTAGAAGESGQGGSRSDRGGTGSDT